MAVGGSLKWPKLKPSINRLLFVASFTLNMTATVLHRLRCPSHRVSNQFPRSWPQMGSFLARYHNDQSWTPCWDTCRWFRRTAVMCSCERIPLWIFNGALFGKWIFRPQTFRTRNLGTFLYLATSSAPMFFSVLLTYVRMLCTYVCSI